MDNVPLVVLLCHRRSHAFHMSPAVSFIATTFVLYVCVLSSPALSLIPALFLAITLVLFQSSSPGVSLLLLLSR